ncbi:hypothetical protein QA802_37300 [Streptomyces sp. B21-105]|uniref:hypothetical protein n=1 Tax=Streptomyces sp. B21-105 TaxID=3039417 RepID=UPI002FF1DF04
MATLLTACALSAALVVAGRGGGAADHTMPGSELVLPAAEGRVLFGTPFTGGSGPGSGSGSESQAHAGTDADGSELDRGLDPGVLDPDAIGPETVPEVPDLPDGGGLIPDGPDESGELGESAEHGEPADPDRSGGLEPSGVRDRSGAIFAGPVDVALG